MEKPRAVIYYRVSDPSQIENNSLETQLTSCQSYADRNGWEVVEKFKEEGVSAKTVHNRPETRRLLLFCTDKRNNIAKVIVYKMDRFARNVEDGLVAISLLAKHGTALVSATEATNDDPMGRAMRTILIALAQLDNEMKGERVKDTMQTMFRNGLWCWKAPIGYTRVAGDREEKRGKPPIIHKDLGPMIKSLIEKSANGYYSFKTLAEYLNSLGFRNYIGSDADGETVKEILSNTFYYGYMYGKKWNEYQWGSHPKLIDKDTWEKSYYNNVSKRKLFKHQDTNTYPLKGLLRCHSCNHTMTTSNSKGNGGYYQSYECHNNKCLHHERIRIETAHDQFQTVLGLLKPSKRVAKLFCDMVFSEWNETIDRCDSEAKLKERQIERLENQLSSIAYSSSKGILTDDEAKERASIIRSEITVLKIEKSDTKIDQYNTEAVKSFTEIFLTNLNQLWRDLNLQEKQSFQSEIFPNGITCQNKEIRTIKFSRSFELIKALKDGNSNYVTPA